MTLKSVKLLGKLLIIAKFFWGYKERSVLFEIGVTPKAIKIRFTYRVEPLTSSAGFRLEKFNVIYRDVIYRVFIGVSSQGEVVA